MDHLLLFPKMNLVMSSPPAALITHILKWMVSLISDIFAMPEKAGLFVGRIIRFTVFFLLPFKSYAPYPSNRTHSPPPPICRVGGREQGREHRTPTVSCHHHILVRFSIHVDDFMLQGPNSGSLNLLANPVDHKLYAVVESN